jgi:hypothetical protein
MNATTGLTTHRINDSMIMDAPALQQMSRKEQILVNRCRILLQVESVSDIASSDGRYLHEAWLNNNPQKPSRSTKRWPKQGDTGKEAWSIWKRFLLRAYTKTDGTLYKKLGDWMQRNKHRVHEAYWSQLQQLMFTPDDSYNRWKSHQLIQAGRRQYIFSKACGETSMLPEEATPIDIIHTSPTTYITNMPSPLRKHLKTKSQTRNTSLKSPHTPKNQ